MSQPNDKNDRFVGPVLKAGDLADAVVEAVEEDNSGRVMKTEEHASYVRIWVEDECLISLSTVQRILGRPVSTTDIEMNMPGFSGFIHTTQDTFRFTAKP